MTKNNITTKEIDIHVGKRLRLARTLRGLSQQKLARLLKSPVSFQQLQKYEKGANRISASRIWDISKVLKVPVSYFFEGL